MTTAKETALRRYSARWWQNKPPAHRFLIGLGTALSAVLLASGLALDRNALRIASTFPSLSGFVWDLATATLLGTLFAAVIDDFKTWGTSWNVLRSREEPLLRALELSLGSVNVALGFGYTASKRSLSRFIEDLRQLDSTFYTFLSKESELTDQRLRALWAGEAPDERQIVTSMSDLMGIQLESRSQEAPGRTLLPDELTGAAADRAAAELDRTTGLLAEELQQVALGTSPGVSTRLLADVQGVRELADDVRTVRQQWLRLAQTQQVSWRDDVTPSIRRIWSTLFSLRSTLSQVQDELETGVPAYNRRAG